MCYPSDSSYANNCLVLSELILPTPILLEYMSKSADDEKSRWDQVMENFNLLFSRVNDIVVIQQELKSQTTVTNLKLDK